jgi:hypothetical protein
MTMFEASSALAVVSFVCLSVGFSCFFCEMTERCNVAFVFVASVCLGVLSLALSSLFGTVEFIFRIVG